MEAAPFGTRDRRFTLAMLWVFVLFNYLYADFLILVLRPNAYEVMAARMPPAVMLGVTLVFELLLAMPLLSWILRGPVNRWLNVITGILGTLWVAMTVGPGQPPAYLAIATIEMAATAFIAWYAWTWRHAMHPEALPTETGIQRSDTA